MILDQLFTHSLFEAADPSRLIVSITIQPISTGGEPMQKEIDLTGQFQGSTASQMNQAMDYMSKMLESKGLVFNDLSVSYQGHTITGQNRGAMAPQSDWEREAEAKAAQMRAQARAQRPAQNATPAVKEAGNANSGRRGPNSPPDNTPVKHGRVEKIKSGIKHHADPSRYGGSDPEVDDDQLLGYNSRHRLHKAVTPDEVDETGLQKFSHKKNRFKSLHKLQNPLGEDNDPKRDKAERMIYKYFGQIYDYGDDDGLNYLDRNGELWNQLMDKYDGEIEDIVAREPTEVLMQAAQELKGIAGDMKYELDEADLADPSRRGFLKKAAGAAAAGAAMSAAGPEIVTLVKGFAEQAGGLNGIQALKAMLKIATPAELYNMYDYYSDSGIMSDAITQSDMIALDRAGYDDWSEFEEHCDENSVDPDDEFERLTGQPLKVKLVDDILGKVDDTWSLEDFFDQYPEAMNIINPPRESLLSMRQLANIDTAAKGANLPTPIVAMANAVSGLVRQIFKSNGQPLAAPQQTTAHPARHTPTLPAPTRPEFDLTPDLKQKEKVPVQRKGDDEEPGDPRKTIQLLVDVGALSRGVLTDKSGMITKEKAQELLNKYYDGNQDMAEGYTGRETKAGTWRVFKDGNAVAVAGPFKSADEAAAWIKKHKQGITEMDKSEPSAGRDGGPREGPEKIAKPITKEKMVKHALDALSKSMAKKDDKKKDVKESDTLMLKLRRALIKEGRVKELADDLKTMSDADFMKKYGKAKAAIRKDMKRVDEAAQTNYTPQEMSDILTGRKTQQQVDAERAQKAKVDASIKTWADAEKDATRVDSHGRRIDKNGNLLPPPKAEPIPNAPLNPPPGTYKIQQYEGLNELSTNKLGQYKTAAAKDAKAADQAGDFKRGDKRLSGMVQATKKQFDNDAKKVDESRAARRALMAQIVNS